MDKSLILRANEIASSSPDRISGHDALLKAVQDRYGDDAAALRLALAEQLTKGMKELARSTHVLPEQDGLFDAPSVIAINTEEGPLFVPREMASVTEVRQWAVEGLRMHTVQRKRFERAVQEVDDIARASDKDLWVEAREEFRGIAAGES